MKSTQLSFFLRQGLRSRMNNNEEIREKTSRKKAAKIRAVCLFVCVCVLTCFHRQCASKVTKLIHFLSFSVLNPTNPERMINKDTDLHFTWEHSVLKLLQGHKILEWDLCEMLPQRTGMWRFLRNCSALDGRSVWKVWVSCYFKRSIFEPRASACPGLQQAFGRVAHLCWGLSPFWVITPGVKFERFLSPRGVFGGSGN